LDMAHDRFTWSHRRACPDALKAAACVAWRIRRGNHQIGRSLPGNCQAIGALLSAVARNTLFHRGIVHASFV